MARSTPVKTPAAEPAEDPALKAAEAQAAADEVSAEREALSTAQAAFGRQRRFEKLARKDPAIAEIYNRMKAAELAVTTLREENERLRTLIAEQDTALSERPAKA